MVEFNNVLGGFLLKRGINYLRFLDEGMLLRGINDLMFLGVRLVIDLGLLGVDKKSNYFYFLK